MYVDGTSILVVSCSDTCDRDLNIPSEIDGKPVTVVGQNAFYNKGIETVQLPKRLSKSSMKLSTSIQSES